MQNKDDRLRRALDSLLLVDSTQYKYFRKEPKKLPRRESVIGILNLIRAVMFPEYFEPSDLNCRGDGDAYHRLFFMLGEQLALAFGFLDGCTEDACELAYQLLETLPKVKERLIKDATAIYEGDPAAVSPEEVILCYPGFYAISIYRIAHEFYIKRIPFISRMMTEYAHEKTGVDIHAGATIGDYFCIDHGTGIVIGETATIGDRVKIYQGVTIGAKSFEVGEDGNPVKGIKRHPDIGNGVVIYANATILGGDTHIGDGVVIGGNVWLTESVEQGSIVYYGKNQEIKIRRRE